MASIYREAPELLSKEDGKQLAKAERERRADQLIQTMGEGQSSATARFESYLYKTRYQLPGPERTCGRPCDWSPTMST